MKGHHHNTCSSNRIILPSNQTVAGVCGREELTLNEEMPSSQHPQQQQIDTPNPSNQTVAGACGWEELTLHDEMPSSQHPQHQQIHTPNPSNQTVAGACGREELTLHDEMPSSQYPQQHGTLNPSNQTVAGACGREEQTLHDEMDLDHCTENFCSGAQEKSTNELQRTLSEHWQQLKQEGHNPEPNTPTRDNPDTQTTPQDTHERSKGQRVSNDQRKKHFYMDSAAAYHSTFDPSVINSYPAHLKAPIQAIQGFGGSTVLVTGYGYIDGPGGKLKNVLLLPDSTANLMCLGQLTWDYPVKVEFYKDKFWIRGFQNGETVGEGHRVDDNHYVVDRFQPDSLPINKRKPSKKKARQYNR